MGTRAGAGKSDTAARVASQQGLLERLLRLVGGQFEPMHGGAELRETIADLGETHAQLAHRIKGATGALAGFLMPAQDLRQIGHLLAGRVSHRVVT
jgi:hypothetical protein